MPQSLGIDTWKEESLSNLTERILGFASKPLILIDGKSGSGKTSIAVKIAEILQANIVATDDICWCADPVHWDAEMLDGIIKPWLDGKNIAYKPSGWTRENRGGFIEVSSCKALIIEGSGACRKTLRGFASFSIWIDAEPDIARTRVIERDLVNGENGGTLESVNSSRIGGILWLTHFT